MSYDIYKPEARAAILTHFYNFVTEPSSYRHLILPDGQPMPTAKVFTDSEWTLQGAQSKVFSSVPSGEACGHVFARGEAVYRCR